MSQIMLISHVLVKERLERNFQYGTSVSLLLRLTNIYTVFVPNHAYFICFSERTLVTQISHSDIDNVLVTLNDNWYHSRAISAYFACFGERTLITQISASDIHIVVATPSEDLQHVHSKLSLFRMFQ